MFKNLMVALFALALIAGCSSKPKPSVIDTVEVGGDLSGDVSSQPLTFDPSGSDGGKIGGLSSIHFGYDQFSLNSDSRSKLAGNADWLKSNTGTSLQIEGHCDARGSIEYNLTLGERRANAVKSYLISLGVNPGRLSVISYGEEKPMSGGDAESSHNANRRANFVPIQ